MGKFLWSLVTVVIMRAVVMFISLPLCLSTRTPVCIPVNYMPYVLSVFLVVAVNSFE